MFFSFGASLAPSGSACAQNAATVSRLRLDLRTGTSLGAGVGLALLAWPLSAAAQFVVSPTTSTDYTFNAATSAGYEAGVSITQTGAGKVIVESLPASISATGVDGMAISAAGGSIEIGGTGGLTSSITSVAQGLDLSTTGAGAVRVKTGAGGLITGASTTASNGAVSVATEAGAINLDLGAKVTATGADSTGVLASSTSGQITITGSGDIESSAAAAGRSAIRAISNTGAITISGAGNLLGAGGRIYAEIASSTATSNILVNRSGASRGIYVSNQGAGFILVEGVGAISGGGALGGIKAIGGSGGIDIGGSAGLQNAVLGYMGDGADSTLHASIIADTKGAISIKTASGGDADGIVTKGFDAATSIRIGSTINAGANGFAVLALTHNSDVTLTNTGTINGAILGSVTAKDANNAYVFKGSGSVTDQGSGKFTLTNSGTINLGSSSISGAWTVSNTGVISSTATTPLTGLSDYFALGKVTINNLAGGVLTGTGTFETVTGDTGSFLRPGDRSIAVSNGVMRTGNLSLAAGSTLDVRADYSGAHDSLAVTGTVTLDQAKLVVRASPNNQLTWLAGPKTFTIITATQGVTGTFTSVTTDLAFLKASASYSANAVTATLERKPFAEVGTNTIQRSVGAGLDPFATNSSNPLIASLLGVTDGPGVLQQLSGASLATARTQAFSAGGMLSNAISAEMGRFTGAAGGGAALSYIEDTRIKTNAFQKVAPQPESIPDGRVWAQYLGGFETLRADSVSGAPSERTSNFGIVAGVDKAFTKKLRVGVAASGGKSSAKVASLATKSDASWGQGALYAVLSDGSLYAKGSLSVGYLSTETERSVTAFSAPQKATGEFGSLLYAARVEIGQRFEVDAVTLTPFLALEPSRLVQNAYREKSTGDIALGFNKSAADALPGTLGFKLDADIDVGGMRLTPSATLGWVHHFATPNGVTPYFVTLPGASFTVPGAGGDRDLARAELSIEAARIGSMTSFFANTRGDLGERTLNLRGAGGMLVRF